MARDGSGNYSREATSPSAGQTISSADYNTELNAIATALTASIAKDGQTTPTANLPMGTYKHTGVAAASGASRTEYVSGAVAQDGGPWWGGTAGGTADALTISPTPAITSYAAGQVFRFIAGASPNTGATTLAVSGLTTKAVQKAGSALAAGDIAAGKTYEVIYDGTAFQIQAYTVAGGVTSVATGSGLTGGPITSTGTISLSISGLSEDTSPSAANDFVATYDASATANKKVKLQNLPGTLRKGTAAEIETLSVNESSGDVAHGLGAAPDFVTLKLVCTDAGGDAGYSQNDEVHLSGLNILSGSSSIASVFADATNIHVRYTNNSLPAISQKASNTAATISNAKWKLVATPWRYVA